jgi:hypothetical protein
VGAKNIKSTMKHLKNFKEPLTESLDVSTKVNNDIKKTGFEIVSSHIHNAKQGIGVIKFKKVRDMNWDPKDFTKFDWVLNCGEPNCRYVGDTFTAKVKLDKVNESEEFEHTNEEGFEYDLLRKFDGSNPDFVNFRKHYTEVINEGLSENPKFWMSNDLAANIILDITEMIKNQGYKIVKDETFK